MSLICYSSYIIFISYIFADIKRSRDTAPRDTILDCLDTLRSHSKSNTTNPNPGSMGIGAGMSVENFSIVLFLFNSLKKYTYENVTFKVTLSNCKYN